MDKIDHILIGSLIGTALTGLLIGVALQFKPEPKPVIQYIQVQRKCDDIIRYEDGSLVCEINLTAEDDVI